MRNDFPQITKEKGCEFRILDSRSHAFHQPYKNMADSHDASKLLLQIAWPRFTNQPPRNSGIMFRRV